MADIDIRRTHRSGTLGAGGAGRLGELCFTGGHDDGPGQNAVQDGEADDRGECEDGREDAHRDSPRDGDHESRASDPQAGP